MSTSSHPADHSKHSQEERKHWVDPASLPNYGDTSTIAGNAPDYVKQLNYNTYIAYGVGDADCFGHAVGKSVKFVEVNINRKRERNDRLEATTIAEVAVTRHMLNGAGMLHGGCIAYIIDNCCSTPLVVLGLIQNTNGVGVTQSMNVLFHSPAPLPADREQLDIPRRKGYVRKMRVAFQRGIQVEYGLDSPRGTTVTSECLNLRTPVRIILSLDLQFGSGQATSASVDTQSARFVNLCLAASNGRTAPIYVVQVGKGREGDPRISSEARKQQLEQRRGRREIQHLPLQRKVISTLRAAENPFARGAHYFDAQIIELKGIVVIFITFTARSGGHGDIAEELASNVFATGLLVVHDAGGCGRKGETYKDDDTESTSGEQQVDPRLDLVGLDVESGRDDTGLVEAAVQLDDDLARTVVIDDLEFADVA
ncbi:hypothetical protein NMY22_g19633 [Coprinellus aureogranulatus]|nr:hypothetical protein NMY22_g19633 [Coprinellus aureogranulatus]